MLGNIKMFWGFIKPYKKKLILALIIGLFASALNLASPMATRWVLDSLEARSSLVGPIITLVGLLISGTILGWWQWVLLGSLSECVVFNSRKSMVSRFIHAKVLHLHQRPIGELVTRVTSDSILLREASSSSIIGIINAIVVIVGSLILMAVLDLFLVIVMAFSSLVIIFLFILLMPAIAKAQQKSQASLAELGSILEGCLRAIKTLKVASAESNQLAKLIFYASAAKRQGIYAIRREALVWSIGWAGIQAATIVILVLGAFRISQGSISVSTLVAFLLYAFGVMGPINQISTNLSILQKGVAAAKRIKEIDLIETEAWTDPKTQSPLAIDPLKFHGTIPIIEFDNVTARYKKTANAAVADLNFSFPRYGHVAIVGSSGAGKSTIFSLLLKFLEPEQGILKMDGIPYSKLPLKNIRKAFSYVEQEAPIVPGTLLDNLLFSAPNASDTEINDVLSLVQLDALVDSFSEGLETKVNDQVISGGQRQRIAIARALLAMPQILLLDEATAHLDSITESAIHEAIRDQSRKGLVITITHRLTTVVNADLVLVMNKAKIISQGSHYELLQTSEFYRDLVASFKVE